ncbi:hypothetical protein BLNAU_21222 [Blattamonas nauphoetae]|uniref:Uncharacterized protein n=1 Tax=Blattamonas nauphoetae TaxID=2049346 RepID=A0ABQ9WWM0_9EUKA|nr:hypothetical protein BLNAU_21222 [Blattamonas nauphoetae]
MVYRRSRTISSPTLSRHSTQSSLDTLRSDPHQPPLVQCLHAEGQANLEKVLMNMSPDLFTSRGLLLSCEGEANAWKNGLEQLLQPSFDAFGLLALVHNNDILHSIRTDAEQGSANKEFGESEEEDHFCVWCRRSPAIHHERTTPTPLIQTPRSLACGRPPNPPHRTRGMDPITLIELQSGMTIQQGPTQTIERMLNALIVASYLSDTDIRPQQHHDTKFSDGRADINVLPYFPFADCTTRI